MSEEWVMRDTDQEVLLGRLEVVKGGLPSRLSRLSTGEHW